MLTVRKIILLVFVWCAGASLSAQVNILFPSERAVFQRDNLNNGFVTISGNAQNDIERIEARLVPFQPGQGTETPWQIVDSELLAGAFSGRITGQAGWYKLEVRAMIGSNVKATTFLNKVGIGEVFVIAGQSNAQGFLRFNPKGSQDDRVNGYAYYKEFFIEENPTLQYFGHIYREFNVGPHGQSAWAWGELGDYIARERNVPVMFFNAAFEGSRIENWVKSIKGETTYLIGDTYTSLFTGGAPYSILRIILQNHISMYGMRCIIWMQGESDYATDGETYYQGLKFLVNQVSKDMGSEPTWMITRTSRNLNTTFPQIIAAQNRVISEFNNVLGGPETDNIQPGRGDGVHLSGGGISELAANIYGYLTANFIFKTPVTSPGKIAELTAICDANNKVTLGVKNDFAKVTWNNAFDSPTFSIQNGIAAARVRDASGNYFISESINVANLVPPAPDIVLIGNLQICQGDSVEYKNFNTDYTTKWMDGTLGNSLKIGDESQVFATHINSKGCASAPSSSKSVRVLSTPPVPTIISSSGSFGACEGGAVSLSVDASANSFVWSTGEVKHDIFVSTPGETTYTVKAISPNGCSSKPSNPQTVVIHTKPAAPEITQDGPFSLAVSNQSEFVTFDWYAGTERISGAADSRLLVSQDGVYSVLGYKTFASPYQATCPSKLSGLLTYNKNGLAGLRVYPNPVVDGELTLTSDVPIASLNLKLVNMRGETVSGNNVIKNVGLPVKLSVPQHSLSGMYILVASYEGYEKRFKLFFK